MTHADDDLAPWQRLGPKFRLGLRARSEQEWLSHADAFGHADRRAAQVAEANHLLDTRHADVFAALDDALDDCSGHNRDGENALAASQEVLEMVQDNLRRFHPGTAPQARRDLHPLEAAARLIPEDLLLLAPRSRDNAKDGSDKDSAFLDWVLVAAALRFPAHWRLADKMGKALAGIHEPVPHYGEILETPMDRFFTRMAVGPISHRWNWTIVTSTALFTPDRIHDAPIAVGDGISRLQVRMESQTLRKLPKSGHILFTIRTYIEPVLNWADNGSALEDLAEMTAAMSDQLRAYKGVERYEAALKAFIDQGRAARD